MMKGTPRNDLGDLKFNETEQSRLASYFCQRVVLLSSMAKVGDPDAPPSLIALRISATELQHASEDEIAMQAEKGDVLRAYWRIAYGPVDRRRRFMEEAQRRGP